jgi:cysteine-rich repeat protein
MAMRRAMAVGAAALVLGGAGCALLGGIEERAPIACETAADCAAQAPSCWTATGCEQGVCAPFSPAPEGTPIAEQAPGDCVQVVCDAAGNTKSIPLAADAPDDGNACTEDTCDGNTPVHTLMQYIPCYTGAPETKGVGACKAGTQECDEQGELVGGCVGEVTPKNEWCNPSPAQANEDEDCDGAPNEGGDNCKCGDSILSIEEGEQCDDGGTEDGDSCSASCMKEWALPVAGYGHTCAILYNKSVKCWGVNKYGELGLGDTDYRGDQPGEMGKNLPVVDLAGSPIIAVAPGIAHTCALTNVGEIKCWGNNKSCQLSDGDQTKTIGDEPMEMGSNLGTLFLGNFTATAISTRYHTCAVSKDGVVICWGPNGAGELGLGHTNTECSGAAQNVVNLGKKATAITTGFGHTCALLEDGSVKCWGLNASGQLGLDDAESRGDGPGEMGESLPSVNLGTNKKATMIAAGWSHTCAILDDGSVKCWGYNALGQLGLGHDVNQGNKPGDMGKLPAVNLGSGKTAKAIAAGGEHTCALLNDGSVKCWGSNQRGQLGLDIGDTSARGDEPNEMGDQLPAVDLGTGKTATAITTDFEHTCAQLNNGSVKCWGSGEYGQLGLGDTDNRGDGPGEMGDNLPTVKLFSDTW